MSEAGGLEEQHLEELRKETNTKKWAFVKRMPRRDLETLAAAAIEQFCTVDGMWIPDDGTDVQVSDSDICEELRPVLSNLGMYIAAIPLDEILKRKPK